VRVLVTGGAGYIGSQTAKCLDRSGFEPIVLDDFRTGHRWAVRWGPLIEGDLAERETVREAIHAMGVEAVVHFAADAYVGDSMRMPREYFRNNVVNTLGLLDVMLDAGVRTIVFSSTCATYGVPDHAPISEAHPQRPVNPYGESKLFVERVLRWYGEAYGLRWCALRYFNAAGADSEGELGEDHEPEPHLIPSVIRAALGLRAALEIYGTDYPTPDGTAIRDYIHVEDLAQAHVLALRHLLDDGEPGPFNLGTGTGFSVHEVIRAVERVSGNRVPVHPAPRRPGDPPALTADAGLAGRILGWRPQRSSLENIVRTAWAWDVARAKDDRVAVPSEEAVAWADAPRQ